MTEKIEHIVTNDSKGYGYSYASLGDIVKQGFQIPKMKTETDPVSQKEYVYYFDKDINDWIRGAQIIVPDNIRNKEGKEKMNAAQLYGSALTYARRYTTLMALQLACDDDKALENNEPGEQNEEKKASDKQVAYIQKIYDPDNIAKILLYYQVNTLNELTKNQASEVIENKRSKNDTNK